MIRNAHMIRRSMQSEIDSFNEPRQIESAFNPVITTADAQALEMYGIAPKMDFGPKNFVSPLETVKQKIKKRNVLDGESVRELSNNVIDLTPSVKEVRKVIKKMVNIIEMENLDNINF